MRPLQLQLSVLLLLLVMAAPSSAYVLRYKSISHRLTENRGSGVYLVDQIVTLFGPSGEPITIQEQWLIDSGSRLRMRARTSGENSVSFDITNIYESTKKTFLSSEGRRLQASLPEGWAFEPLLFVRTSASLNLLLQKLKILSPKDLIEDKLSLGKNTVELAPKNFVRLARVGGTVSYSIGPAPKSAAENELPGIWIEQDSFVVRKIRLPSGAVLNAKKYSRHDGGLWLPQEREIIWGDNRAMIEVVNAKRVAASTTINKRFSTTSLNPKDEPHLLAKIPEVSIIKEFYSLFR